MRAISSEVVKGETMLARDSVWVALRPKQIRLLLGVYICSQDVGYNNSSRFKSNNMLFVLGPGHFF